MSVDGQPPPQPAGRPPGQAPGQPARQRAPQPARRPSGPGKGPIALLAFAMVLVPGIGVFAVLRAVGLGIGPAGSIGLLMMFVGMGAYPVVLRRTGWVGPR